MDRAERTGLAVAIGAHVVLFAVLSFGLVSREMPKREAVAVTLTDEIGAIATAADRPAPAARSEVADMVPPPLEPLVQPSIAPTPPPAVRPAPTPPRTERQPERTEPRRDERPRRRPDSRLDGITEGIAPSNDSGSSSSQAAVSSSDRSNLISRIVSAVRPCYNLGSLSGTSAEDIVVSLRIRPSRNGTISSGQVSVQGYDGVTGANREYRRQMAEAARSAVLNPRCPFPNLPDDMYENGWSDVVLRFIPAQLT